jgi:transposase
MTETTKTLAYRYRLRLTPAQEDVLDRSQEELRLVWNHFVRSQRWAEREWQHGRAASITKELLELSLAKQPRGQALASARKLATEHGISDDEALRLRRQEFVGKVAKIPTRKKDGSRCLRIARRKLATAYADAVVNGAVDSYNASSTYTYNALRLKFERCSDMWIKGKFRRPRFKRKGEPVALQKQVLTSGPFTLQRFSDLSAFGGQALKKCEVIIHRPLPLSAEAKQIAISGRRGERHLIIMFNAALTDVAKDFPATQRTAGIDPGIKVSLTVTPLDSPDFGTSDSRAIQPRAARDLRFLKRLRRLQRKHDRQRRTNNPDCFDEQGRWRKGKRIHTESENMARTQTSITAMQTHLAESRRDFYHNAACDILRQFDNVAIGKWRPARTRQRKPTTPSPKGLGAARRATNRISYDHAISLFISYLKDKADRSTTAKEVREVSEAGSTRNCPKCGKPTGPTGSEGLTVRAWTCRECGTTFQRDAAAAWQIAKRFSTEVASTSQSAESQDPAQKRRRQRRLQVPVADEAAPVRAANASATLSQKPPVASGAVSDQACRGARASQPPVTAVDGSPSCAAETPDTLRKQDTLANAAGATSGSTRKDVRRRRR